MPYLEAGPEAMVNMLVTCLAREIDRKNEADPFRKFAAALRLLEAVGFERQTDGGDDVLVLTRADPGLLWLGRSALADLKSGTTA